MQKKAGCHMKTKGTVMRVFIAAEFPEPVRDYLFRLQQEIRKVSRSGNFTHRDNFHLTLRFIGETGGEERVKLQRAMDAAVRKGEPFSLMLGGLGHFPRGSRHILWVGLKSSGGLQLLHDRLEEELETCGVSKEGREYAPHVTLGREVWLDGDYSVLAGSVPTEDTVVPVEHISLMQSTRINGQLKYIPLYRKEIG